MQNTTNDMTRGNSMKLIFQFFLPILIGNLFQQLYSFVDSMVVGKGLGDTAPVYLSADAGGYDDGYSRVFRNNPGRKHHHDFQ